jgi:hypothetical protein
MEPVPCRCISRSQSRWGSARRRGAPRLSSAYGNHGKDQRRRRGTACSVSLSGRSRSEQRREKKDADLLGHDGGVGVLDDRGQGAVVVQEHHDMLPLRRRERRLEPRQCRGEALLCAVGISHESIDRFRCRKLEHASAQRVQRKTKKGSIYPGHVTVTRTIQSPCSSSAARRGEEDFMVSAPAAARSICAAVCFLRSRASAVASGGNDEKCCCAGAATASSATKVECFVMVDEMDRKLAAKEGEQGTRGVKRTAGGAGSTA